MKMHDRPLSPHLQIYRLPLVAITSITHRVTGALLAVGAMVVVYWLVSAAAGPEAYADARVVLGNGFVQLLMVLWTYALFYHLCNGVRHLLWDGGYGFELDTARRSGIAVFVLAGVLTALAWLIAAIG